MSRWFDTADLLPLWQAVHTRLSSGGRVSSVRVGAWSESQRQAVADLLGLDRVPATGTSIALEKLEAAVAEIGGPDVRGVVEHVVGPVGDRRAEQEAARAERAGLWAWLESSVAGEPALLDWVAHLRSTGLVGGSVPRTRELAERALTVLAALPADGIPLPVFADRVLGDPHGLDDGQRLTGVVLRALAFLLDDVPGESRETWRRMGVEGDALSSTVLVAGFGPGATEGGSAAAVLPACAEAGEAAVLTLQQVRSALPSLASPLPGRGGISGDRSGPAVDGRPGLVHVVENPSVMASALARFGSDCPPLVCVSGWPSAAGMLFLRAMSAAGAEVRYHGDLDGDGLRIAAHVVARAQALPWRMTTNDYEHARSRRPHGPPVGRVTDVPWDSGLAAALRRDGIAVPEESVVDDLLADLSAVG